MIDGILCLPVLALLLAMAGVASAQEPILTSYAALQETLGEWAPQGVTIDRSQISLQGRELGAQPWRIGAAHQISVSYFEEHPLDGTSPATLEALAAKQS